MSNVSLDLSSEAVAIPRIPCTHLLCGRWACSPIDWCFLTGEVGTGLGVAFGIVSGYSWVSYGFGALELVLLSSHGLVKKYGDLAVIAQRVKEAVQKLEEARNGLQGANQELRGSLQVAERNNGELARQNELLQANVNRLGADIEGIQSNIEKLKKENNSLQANNEELKRSIALLEGGNRDLEAQVAKLDQVNKGLEKQVASFREASSELSAVPQGIARVVSSVKHRFDDLGDDYKEELSGTEKLVAGLQVKIDELKREQESLKKTRESLEQEKRELDEKYDRLIESSLKNLTGKEDANGSN